MQPLVHQIMHSLVRHNTITNDYHIHTRVLLRRLLMGWIEWHIRSDWDPSMYFLILLFNLDDSIASQNVHDLPMSWMCRQERVYST